MTQSSDLISVVEAAYDLEGSDAEWLTSLATVVAPFLDQGSGLMAGLYDASDPARFLLSHCVRVGGAADLQNAGVASTLAGSPQALKRLYWRAPCFAYMSEHLGSTPPEAFSREVHSPFGFGDVLGLKSLDASHRGVILCTFVKTPRRIARTERARWSMIGAHIAAGFRLRENLEHTGQPGVSAAAAAVLTPDGRVAHAEADAKTCSAREALRAAAKRMDAARSRLRLDDADQAVELWRALVAGKWSLLEHFESDGRRVLVARRNDPDAADPRALTPREKQTAAYLKFGWSDKLIGYRLGLSPSTVSNHAASLQRKLGARSRADLVGLLRLAEGAEESN